VFSPSRPLGPMARAARTAERLLTRGSAPGGNTVGRCYDENRLRGGVQLESRSDDRLRGVGQERNGVFFT
jgi:hypothetical protein